MKRISSLLAVGAGMILLSASAEDLFRVTADGASAVDYATFEAAAAAANEIPNSQTATIALLGNATFSASVSFMRNVTLTSEGGPWTLTRTTASTCIYVGTNITTGAIGAYTSTASKGVTVASDCNYYDLQITDLTIDGGAVWASEDVTDMTNTGVGAGCLFYVYGWMKSGVYKFASGRVILASGGTVQNAEAQDYSTSGAPCAVFAFYEGGGNSKLRIDAGGKLTRCRGATMSVCWLESRYYPEGSYSAGTGAFGTGQGTVHVAGGEISFCAMNDAQAAGNRGGVVGGTGGGFSIDSGSVHDNYSANCGGVASVRSAGTIHIRGGVLYNNRAQYGGIIYHGSGWYSANSLQGGVLTNNVATVRGGAICLDSTSAPPQFYLKGETYVAGNWIDDGTNPKVENNIHINHSDTAKIVIAGTFPDGAHVGLTVQASCAGVDAAFATIADKWTSLTAHDLQGIFCDTDATLAVTNRASDGKAVWMTRGYDGVAEVTVGATTTAYPSLRDALAAANGAGAAATVTLNDDVTMSADYEVSGTVTLAGAKAVTVAGGTLVVANGGRLSLAGANLTLDMTPVVRSGGRLDFLPGCSTTVTGSLALQAGGLLGLAGSPSFAGDIAPATGDQIILMGPVAEDYTVDYPSSANYYDIPFAAVADGYTATDEDAGHFIFKNAADVAGVVKGQTLAWPPKEVATDDFALTVDGETTRYTSLGAALQAANAVDASKEATVTILKDTTFEEPVSIMRGMTITSGAGGPFVLKRKSAYGRILIGTNVWDGSIIEATSVGSKAVRVSGDRAYYEAVVTNLIVDGGARWTSDDVTSMANTGVGASALVQLYGIMTSNFRFAIGGLILENGAVVRNVEASDVAPLGAISIVCPGSGTARLCVRKGARVTRLRGALTSPIYQACNQYPSGQGGCSVLVDGGEISFCARNDAGASLLGGVAGGSTAGFGITSGSVHDNHSANRAGVFTCSQNSSVYVTGGTFYNNTAQYGGVFFQGSGVWTGHNIAGGVFSNNVASVRGGAICLEATSAPSQLTFAGGTPVLADNWVDTGTVRRRSNVEATSGCELKKILMTAAPARGAKIGLTTGYADPTAGDAFLTLSDCTPTEFAARCFFFDVSPNGRTYRGARGAGDKSGKLVWTPKPGFAIEVR